MSGTNSLDTVIALVRRALAGTPEPRSSDRPLAAVDPVTDVEGRAPGWYRVARPLSPVELDYATEGQLVRGSGPRAVLFDVLEVAVDGDVVRVRASVTAPRERLSLTVRGAGQRRVPQGLADGLGATRADPLLGQFAAGRLTPVRTDPALRSSAHAWDALEPEQREAVAACCAPGLHLVRGPPGTGRRTSSPRPSATWRVRAGASCWCPTPTSPSTPRWRRPCGSSTPTAPAWRSASGTSSCRACRTTPGSASTASSGRARPTPSRESTTSPGNSRTSPARDPASTGPGPGWSVSRQLRFGAARCPGGTRRRSRRPP